ncbi:PAS-domain containing protein [Sediminicoccus sp. KRV36]|uniref:PAS-domain containing protein n=1 Tax=Sediminicoccus sp. KRV36 TaxID=3133721 RepID=UPI00200EEA22|nr:PAS-domain containing protein [Sediminicoccus rosea]UPY38366.1 PAS-domain containing protein [Sediminicoccus rosea]
MPDHALPAEVPNDDAALIEALFSMGESGFLQLDPQLRVRRASDAFGRMLRVALPEPGCGLADWLGGLLASGAFAAPSALPHLLAPFQAPDGSTARWARADGRAVHLTVRALPGGGRLASLNTIRAEEDQAHELLRSAYLLENVTDAVVLMDPQGVILDNSTGRGDLLGLPDDLVKPGRTHHDILRFMYRRGDYGAEMTEESFVAQRRAMILAAGRFTLPSQMPDGRWAEYNFRPLPNGDLLILVRDVTELRNALAALEAERAEREEERRRAALLLESTEDAILLFDAAGTLLEASRNCGEMFGLPPELFAKGATHAGFLRAMHRRGDYGLAVAEEDFITQARDEVARPGRVQGVHLLPNGRWVEMNLETRPDATLLVNVRDITDLKNVQLALEAEQQKLRRVMDNMRDGVMLFDADLRWTIVSEPILRFFDLPAHFGVGTSLRDVTRFQLLRGDFGPVPDTEAERIAAVEARIEGLLEPGGRRYVRKTLNGYWLDIRMQPMPDGGLLAFYRDVTLLKQQEEQVEAERHLLLELLNGLDEAVVLLGPDQAILASNARGSDFLPERPDLLAAGGSMREVLRHLYRRGEYGTELDEEARITERMEFITHPAGQRYTRPSADGRWVEFQYTPLSGGRTLLQARDVTPLKRREAEVEEQRALLAEVLNSMDAMVVLLDADARVIMSNGRGRNLLDIPAELVDEGGSLRESMRYMYRRGDFGFDEPETVWVDGRVDAVLSGKPIRLTRPAPGNRWLEFSYSPIGQGRIIAQGRDVTALKASEQAAIAAKEAAEAAALAKSSFLAAMSHEIRTPMNGVLGMLEVLGRSELKPDQARSVTVMRESAHSLLRIIDDVLDFSKIEAGRLDVEAMPFSLRAMVDGTIETLTPEAKRRGLALFADQPGPGPDWLEGDPTRVRQILFNLVGNALKFTERGFVRIAAHAVLEKDAGSADGLPAVARLTLSVEDSGVGMDEATLGRLFQPFTQADSSTTRRFGGTGLGLSIVRRLAELMGGEVRAESDPGRGSRFTVTLRLGLAGAPAAPNAAALHTPMHAPAAGHAAGGVLVVDDHPVNREVLLRQLELLGLGAGTAVDGGDALRIWREERQSIILLDIHMPVMDGFELARAIRAEEQRLSLPRTTLIAVTANALKGEAERCYAAGMDGFLAKPVTLDGLSRALSRFLPEVAGEGPAQGGALFDPEALRGLFGQDRARLSSILESFAEQARHDIQGMQGADAKALGLAAHRLKGAARMVGARLLAEQAQAVETALKEQDAARIAAATAGMDALLTETLSVARPLLDRG